MGIFSNISHRVRITFFKHIHNEYLTPKLREISSRHLVDDFKIALEMHFLYALEIGRRESLDAHIKRGAGTIFTALNAANHDLIHSAALCLIGLYVEIYARGKRYPEWRSEYGFMKQELTLRFHESCVSTTEYSRMMGDL